MPKWLRNSLPIVISLAIFLGALEVLRVELHAVTWPELTADVLNTPASQLFAAIVLTALNYLVLTGYDMLAFAYIGRRLSRLRIGLVSFIAYAVSNSVGLSVLSGASVRYRFYTRWGVKAEELTRIIFSYSVTFWLGLLALGGLSLAISPLPDSIAASTQSLLRPIGCLLMLLPLIFLAASVWRKKPLRLHKMEFPLPTPRIAVAQTVISAVDWMLAGAVLYVLLPAHGPGFLTFLGIFLVAILLGMISHVPGGVGVFEGLMILLLRPYFTSGQLLPALVVFRAIYYLLPLACAIGALIAYEVWRKREHVARAGARVGHITERLSPRVLAVLAFLAGVVLLFSGATPAATGRLEFLDRMLPLTVIEASHFLGSVAGAALLVLSQGLARRLDAAYYFTAIALVTGTFASLLKGFDYEEASIVLLTLLVLRRSRPAFDRRAAFFDTRFSGTWMAAMAGAAIASVWLGFFAFKHVDYSSELWWQFELQGEASRFLRATVGVAITFLLVAIARMISFAPHEMAPPSEQDLNDAARIIAGQPLNYPYLAFLRDKALLFNEDRTAFIMYGVQGRTWMAMGDPVGPPEKYADLMRAFLDRCDDFGGEPVFYEVSKQNLHVYADFGFTFVKLGEEAKVDLAAFTLEGSAGYKHRQALRRLEREGGAFRIVDVPDVPAIMAQLREVSDDWLDHKATAEKGFSLGFFDENYLANFPVAVIEQAGRIVAFANIWRGGNGTELSVDLMRYRRDAPKGVMEALFIHMLQWGQQNGYRWFGLGMAPLSGFESSALASMWNRLGSFLYEHTESVYNFQGLRAYKEKFSPRWEPKYLAYPGGLRLPRILANMTALVAGGYRKIFFK
jgi:phosphatidylglycerol lysyltransferase